MNEDLDKQDNGVLVNFERWMGRTGLALVPQSMSANQVTLFSCGCGVLAGLAYYLASFGRAWFAIGAVLTLMHWAADNIDGHVARSRNQCSQAGRFLDIFLDAVTFAALGIGLACADYTYFPIVAVATILSMLQYVLTVLWIALTRIWPFPVFGPGEALLTLIVLSILMLFLPKELFVLRGISFSLIDVAFVLTILSSTVTLFMSALALFKHLQREAETTQSTMSR
ncbi:MAG: CDP-alcohol phosphatidyltransferase family protein [Methylobacter sp.]